ncbi:DNA-processing protein DprA [Candidatus Saccharibacteria bacterium]|nr:DNA-processing protein DprA [Candidatus Saccharibacteria bacterium]
MNYRFNFIACDRIIAGLANAALVSEAALKSGSLHTARFALEQNRDVLAVSGNITSSTSVSINNLIRSSAKLISNVNETLEVLGLTADNETTTPIGDTTEEQVIINLMAGSITSSNQLLIGSKLSAASYNQSLTILEIQGVIRPLGNNQSCLQ